jgi:hypothetical protein
VAKVGELSVALTASVDGLSAGFKKANKLVEGFGTKIFNMKNLVAAAGTALAGSALTGFVSGQLEEVDKLSKLATTLDVSTESLVGLQYAGDLAGVSTEALGTNLFKLSKTLGLLQAGDRLTTDTFAQLGLSAQQFAGMDTIAALGKLADHINTLPTATERAAAAFEIFGRQAKDIMPLLSGGSAGIKEGLGKAGARGLLFSNEQGLGVEGANDAVTEASKAIDGLWRQLAVQLAPTIQKIAEGFSAWATAGEGAANRINAALEGTFKIGGFFLDMWETAKGFFSNDKSMLEWIQGGGSTKHREGVEKFLADRKAMEAANKKAAETAKLQEAAEQPTAGLAAYNQRVKDAAEHQKALKKATEEAAKAAKKANEEWAKEGEKLSDSLHTPLEAFYFEIQKMQEYLAAGFINPNQFALGLGDQMDKLGKAQGEAMTAPSAMLAGSTEAVNATIDAGLRGMEPTGRDRLEELISRQKEIETEQLKELREIAKALTENKPIVARLN